MDALFFIKVIKDGQAFNFKFKQIKLLNLETEETIMESENTLEYSILKYRPGFPNGTLSLDFSDFRTLQANGLFRRCFNNGFDFIIHPRMWVPYVYDNKADPSNPLYSLQYKIDQMEFDTICINCDRVKLVVEVHCSNFYGDFCILLSNPQPNTNSDSFDDLFDFMGV